MAYRRRFLPLIIFGILGLVIMLVADRQVKDAKQMAQYCRSAATCAQTQADFTNAILVGLFGTALIIVGGFVSVLVGQRDRQPSAGAPWPQHSAAPPPADMTNYRPPGHPG